MTDPQQFARRVGPDPELKRILEPSRKIPLTEEELDEQEIDFAFGLCRGQYDLSELAAGPPLSACNTVRGVGPGNKQAECHGERDRE